MSFDTELAARLQELFQTSFSDVPGLTETRMFGGFGYMLNGNMCVGIHKHELIVRVGVEQAESLLEELHVRPMDLTGRVMSGWAIVTPEGTAGDRDLERYCRLAIKFVQQLPAKK